MANMIDALQFNVDGAILIYGIVFGLICLSLTQESKPARVKVPPKRRQR